MLNSIGIFDLSALTNEERLNYSDKRHYDTHANGLSVMTDWTIELNVPTSAIGSASSRIALLVSEFCTKSAIVVVAPGSF